MIAVAHLIHTMAHGGVETALINWVRAFDRQQVRAHLLCLANPDASEQPFVDAAGRAGLHVGRIPWGRFKPVRRAARAVAAFVRHHQVDVLHCHNAYANLVGLIAARTVPVKTLTTVYMWSKVGWKRRALQRLDQHLLPYFDQVSAHCEAARRDTASRGYDAERIRLLTCGFTERVAHLDQTAREQMRRAMGVRADETVLISVARFWPEKRHDVLLRAFERLLRQHLRVRLWIPGVGPEEARIRALAEELGLVGHVDLLGFRHDLPELLALADIQVHSSDEEGVPLAILSGMAAGRPIVSTGVGGIVEVLDHDHSGVLVPRGDPAALADAVASLIDDPVRQHLLGRRAQEFIRDEYSLEAATRRVEAVYGEMVGR